MARASAGFGGCYFKVEKTGSQGHDGTWRPCGKYSNSALSIAPRGPQLIPQESDWVPPRVRQTEDKRFL